MNCDLAISREVRLATLGVALGVLALACATPQPSGPRWNLDQPCVWPASPEPARVEAMQIVTGPEDLITERGLWRRLSAIVGGESTARLVNPSAVAMDPTVGLVVGDTGLPGIHIFDWVRNEYVLAQGDDEHPIDSPVGVAITPGGIIFVTSSTRAAITMLSFQGEVVGEITDPGRLQRPAGIVYDSDRNELVVVDVLSHCVRRYTPEGEHAASFGSQGAGPGEFNFPTHIARLSDGRLAVTDSLNFRVQVLTADGDPLATIGQLGDAPGSLARPKGIAADSADNLWVVDAQFENVQVFNTDGELLLHFGGSGHGPGQFWLPSGLAFDADDMLCVADTYNHRVQLFQCHPELEVTP